MRTIATDNTSAGIISQHLRQMNQAHPVMIQVGNAKPIAMDELRVDDDELRVEGGAVIMHAPAPKAKKKAKK